MMTSRAPDVLAFRVAAAFLPRPPVDPLANASLLPGHGEGDHDLHDGVASHADPFQSRFHEGPDLHGVQTGLDHPEAHPSGAQHRVELVPGLGRFPQPSLFLGQAHRGVFEGQLLGVGQELVQWRVEQADGHRQAVHGLEDLPEVSLLGDAQLL